LPTIGLGVPLSRSANKTGVNLSFFSSVMLQNVKARIEPAAANDHNSPLRSQQLQVVPEVHIGKHLKNEVHTPPAGGFQYLFPVVRVGVIEDVTCALRFTSSRPF
jgi:hypothetical protein